MSSSSGLASSSSRSQELWRNTPVATTGIIAVCCALYVLCWMQGNGFQLHHWTLCPRQVLYLHEYYRLVTSAVLHGGFFHLAMNMASCLAVSTALEQRVGTIRHVVSTAWAILLVSAIFILMAYLLSCLFGNDTLLFQHAVGFSGVLFHMTVLECLQSNNHNHPRTLFGFVTVPAWLFPWALLIVVQFLMPNISFAGHLSGILTGHLQVYGCLDFLLLTDESFCKHLETQQHNSAALAWLVSRPNFIPTPTTTDHILGGSNSARHSPAALRRHIREGFAMVAKCCCHAAETLQVIVFGRGREANANIHFPSIFGRFTGPRPVPVAVEDDDDWGGLPPMQQTPKSNIVESLVV